MEAEEVKGLIEQIRDETREHANTATRVGNALMEMFNYTQQHDVKMQVITEDAYDKLVAEGKVDGSTFYNILEEQ